MSGEFDPSRLINEAMVKRDQTIDRAIIDRQRAEESPCPPDPKLEALFREFAQRMPDAASKPLVIVGTEFLPVPRNYRFPHGIGKPKTTPENHYVHKQIGRGWFIRSGKEAVSTYGIAVDTEGKLFLALSSAPREGKIYYPNKGSYPCTSAVLALETSDSYVASPGIPKGPNLRKAIMNRMGIRHEGLYGEVAGREKVLTSDFPEYLARLMADTIREAGAN